MAAPVHVISFRLLVNNAPGLFSMLRPSPDAQAGRRVPGAAPSVYEALPVACCAAQGIPARLCHMHKYTQAAGWCHTSKRLA